jgi:hypothetical protein
LERLFQFPVVRRCDGLTLRRSPSYKQRILLASSTRWTRLVVGVTAALVGLPVLVDVVSGRERPFAYLAEDAFYYLTVARNIALHGSVSFDQMHAANGFHPLWQFVLAGVYGLAALVRTPEPWIIALSVLVGVGFLVAAVVLLARAFSDEDRPSALFALVPVGLYSLLLLPAWHTAGAHLEIGHPVLYGTLWASANGMESAVTLLAFAACAYLFVRREPLARDRDAILFGAALSAFVLARLDHVFFPAGLLAILFAGAALRRDRAALRRVILAGVACAVPIALYCLCNRVFFGIWMPASGNLKSSFPHVNHNNLAKTWAYLANPLGFAWWRSYREAQIVLPVLAGVVFIAWLALLRRRPLVAADRFLALLFPGVVALALYNDLFVELFEQGQWYFPVSTLYVSLVALRMLDATAAARRLRDGRGVSLACLAACAAVSLFVFLRYQRISRNERLAQVYYDVAPRIRAHYGDHPPRLFEVADGIIAFSTGFPTMSGKGYLLDPEAIRKKAQLMDLVVARGYDRVASVGYFSPAGLRLNSPSDVVAQHVAGDDHKFRYTAEFLDGDLLIVRLEPR